MQAEGRPAGRPARLVEAPVLLARRIPASLPLLVLRVAVALPFLASGMTKWTGFLELSPAAVYLFSEEFRLHLFGGAYGFPFPAATAFLSGLAEIVLPVMLLLGLGTRYAAFGLLLMTGVIQLTVPDGWRNFHLPWAAMLFALLAFGPGRIALDAALERFWPRKG